MKYARVDFQKIVGTAWHGVTLPRTITVGDLVALFGKPDCDADINYTFEWDLIERKTNQPLAIYGNGYTPWNIGGNGTPAETELRQYIMDAVASKCTEVVQ